MDGWTTFIFTPAVAPAVTWNGERSLSNTLCVLGSGRNHEALITAHWGVFEIDIEDRLIERERLFQNAGLSLDANAPHIRIDPVFADRARSSLAILLEQGLASGLMTGQHQRNQIIRRNILDIVKSALASAVDDASIETKSHTSRLLFHQARTFLDEHAFENPRIAHIASDLGVANRTLQRCFKNEAGVSPKQYLIARKLDKARRILMNDRNTSIADLAHAIGFSSPSRFSEQYYRQFGVSPSLE